MSYLPPGETGYFSAVQVYFTEVTDRLAIFNARDQALLKQWKDEGCSAQVICRGIREAVLSLEDGEKLRSLAQCKPFVEREWKQIREKSVGSHGAVQTQDLQPTKPQPSPAPEKSSGASWLFEETSQAIVTAGKATENERWRQAYRRAFKKLKRLAREGEDFSFAELEAVDKALVDAYLEALEEEERRSLEDALASVGAGLMQAMSPGARKEHLYVRRKKELVERFGLLDLIEVVGG